MRLKTLELQGYKSFATKTVLRFDQGITAVVGPNGSGKSNVADALRWALGEQSYGTLRGKKTEDMIFSGSDGRPRLGMAQAGLVLDNYDGWLPVEFTEVTITRRAFRDGLNEYMLNGNRVRLRDITELLAPSGLSRRTYTVIGQGLVDAALSLRAEERRALIEEAAGITLHRSKRADALQKLDATQANLLRVNDIVSEIEPRLRYLKRQAERAAEHQAVSAQLRDLLHVWYGYSWGRGQKRLHEARAVVSRSQADLDAQQERLQRVGAQIADLRARQTDLRTNLSEWHRKSSNLHNEAETLQRALAVSEERARLLSAQSEELTVEIESIEVTRQAADQRAAEIQASVAQVESELESAQNRVRRLRARFDAHQAERQALLDQQFQAETEARTLADRIAGHRARLSQLDERRSQVIQEIEEGEQVIVAHRQTQEALGVQLTEYADSLHKLDAELVALERERAAELTAIQKLAAQADELREELANCRRRLDALHARQDLLSRMQQDLAGFYEGVRTVVKAAHDGRAVKGIIGTVARLFRAPAELETAIETALGGNLQDVVVETWADAEMAIAHLKATHAGRATFLPLDTLRPPERIQPPEEQGVLGIASDLVTYDAHLDAVARLLLGRTLVVENLPAARRILSTMHGGFQIVTRAGELVRSGGSVSGGSVSRDKASGGFLAREREWRELPSAIAEKEARRQAFQARLDENQRIQAQHQSTAEERSLRLSNLGNSHATIENEREALGHAIERAEEAIKWQQNLQARLGAERIKLDQSLQRLQAEIEGFQTAQNLAQERARELATQASSLSAEALLTDLSQDQTALAVIEGRRDSLRTVLDGHRTSLKELDVRLSAKKRRTEELVTEREALLTQMTVQREQTARLNREIAEVSALIEPAETELRILEEQQTELEAEERQGQELLRHLESDHNRLALEFGRCQDELEMLRRQIEDDLGLVEVELSEDQVGQPYLPLHPLISELRVVDELPEGVENDMRRFKVQLSRLGSVNPNAPKEFKELLGRHEFLTQQMNDLEQATANLRQVISELDRLMEQEFSTTFEAVAEEFKRYFTRLFGGGKAQLVLTDPDNLTDTGIDISARPPGKRLQGLNMLSGGERALTAVALIFALLRVSPTPFCVLDEVDAMLDEVNVARFRQELQDLAQDTQFIIITHNRHTIEAANTIYGVSMGADSVSRIISLKLDEVEESGIGS